MIFKKLILKNFKSHVNTSVEFDYGTTIILGENGAGKSSIFEGINFALYKKYNTKSLNDLINTKADKMTVTLHFLIGSTEYKVTRTRNQTKSTADLYVLRDDKFTSLVSGDKEVNNHITDLLEMDADLFLNAIYIKQGEIDSLVTQKASERKQNISKLLRLENLEITYKNLPHVITAYELKCNQLKTSLNDISDKDKQLIIDENEQLSLEKEKIGNQLSEIQKELKEIKSKITEQTNASVIYQQLNNRKTQKMVELNGLETERDILEKDINSFELYEGTVNNLKDIDQKIFLCENLINENRSLQELMELNKQLDNKRSLYLERISYLNDIGAIYNINVLSDSSYDKDNLNQLIEVLTTDIQETQNELSQVQSRISQIAIEIPLLNKSIIEKKELLETINETDGLCPVCQSEINFDRRSQLERYYLGILEEEADSLETLENEYEILLKEEKELSQMFDEKTKFMTFINNNKVICSEIDTCISDLKTNAKAIRDINYKIDNITLEDISTEYDIQDLLELKQEYAKQKESYEEAKFALKNKEVIIQQHNDILIKINREKQEIKNLNIKLENNNYDVSLLQEYQKKESELQSQYYPIVKESGDLESKIKYNNIKLYNIDEQIQKNKDNQKKIKHMEDFIIFLKEIRELYSKDGLQKTIRLSFRPQIQKNTQDFFAKFGFDYSNLLITDDYDIVISGPSGESNVNMISGGEKIAVALALRLGIAQAVTANKIETILLDEPTTYLDEYRKQEFIQIIQNISLLPQLIIITHDAELVNAASTIINVEKADGKSVIT